MQLKMEQRNIKKFDKQKFKEILKEENDYIMDLLTTFDVPDTIEDEELDRMYLTNNSNDRKSGEPHIKANKTDRAQTADELEERLEIIKNKMKTKKSKISARTIKKREMKKLKKDKELKKKLISVHKADKNEKIKVEQLVEDNKDNIKQTKQVFNEEGKIVYSKFDFAPHPGAKAKKSKNEKYEKNPRKILQNIKEENKKLTELVEKGEEEKAKDLKQEMAWKKVFDKTEGKKVKDDPSLLYKAIKKRKIEKKKSKKEWIERKKKVEHDIAARQKKRQENIDKKIKEKKNRKLKRLSKKGRVIPGF